MFGIVHRLMLVLWNFLCVKWFVCSMMLCWLGWVRYRLWNGLGAVLILSVSLLWCVMM